MAYDWLKGVADEYDVIVIGSGLGGMTGANVLAKAGHRVLLLEHHYQFGGLATWFTRKGGHIFDISLHGFPVGMIKSCRKYWTKEIADAIVQLKDIRFVNPQMDVWTTFTREDYTRVLVENFRLDRAHVEKFYDHLRSMNFYDNNPETTGEMLERFFPGRDDVKRLLMEPIAYANGSTLDDPAITYGIVFSNFMGSGVYTFRGGSDVTSSKKMAAELRRNGVELRKKVLVEKILIEDARRQRTCRLRDRRRERPRHPRQGRALQRQHQEHDFPPRRGGELPRRLPRRRASRAHQLQLVPGLPRHPQGREHPAHRRPGVHLGESEVQQRRAHRLCTPRAARSPSITLTPAPARIATPSSSRSTANTATGKNSATPITSARSSA